MIQVSSSLHSQCSCSSPPFSFSLDQAAASRFCAYWTFRKKLFKDRAFLPFSLDGSGIMSEDDIALLKTRAYVLLPPDEHARAVVFYDKSMLDNVVYERESLVSVTEKGDAKKRGNKFSVLTFAFPLRCVYSSTFILSLQRSPPCKQQVQFV